MSATTGLFHYSLETSAIIAAFTLFYFLALRKERFFVTNRFFLLFAMTFAMVVPLLNIHYGVGTTAATETGSLLGSSLQQAGSIKDSIIRIDAVVIRESSNTWPFTLRQIPGMLLLAGITIHLGLFAWRFTRLLLMIKKSEKEKDGSFRFVKVPGNTRHIYSFFRFIFIGKDQLKTSGSTAIVEHEKNHAAALHSVDLIITELLIAFQWFNPFVYLLRKAVIENHEFQADHRVVQSQGNKVNYLQTIMRQWMNHHYLTLTSSFSHSLSKTRIQMLTNTKSSNPISKAKLLAVIPLSLVLFFLFACSEQPKEQAPEQEKEAIAFDYVTRKSVGTQIPSSLYHEYHKKLEDKGEQILYELHARFEGNKYPKSAVRLENNTTYGFHLYNYTEGKTNAYIEVRDTSGQYLGNTSENWQGGMKEQSFYVDIPAPTLQTGPYTVAVKDSKNRSNKVVLVITKATSLSPTQKAGSEVYLKPDQMPVYDGHGSLADFRTDVMKNIQYPEEAREKKIDGMVHITFVVNKQGRIEDKEVMNEAHPLLNQAALEALDGLPSWEPGKVDGRPVKTQFTIPVVFKNQ